MSARILIVDDDRFLLENLRRFFLKNGYEVETALSGEDALAQLESTQVDAAILDVGLPGMDGVALCRRLRAKWRFPVLMLTARSESMDKVVGLEVGADDYITKPFSTQELLARIRAVLRRRASEHGGESVSVGSLHLDPATHRVSYAGQPLKLGPTEFKLLHHLMRHAERVHSRAQLLDKVWGDHVYIEERTVDVHVKRLREALGEAAAMVETVRGAGYRVTAQGQQ